MKASKRPFNLSIRAQASGRYAITIRGIIGEYFDAETWTIKDTEEDVLNELKKIPEDADIDVYINTRGGDVGLGLGIYNALSRRKDHVTTHNCGYALSAGSIAMLAGHKRVSPAASVWMIHRAQGGSDGTCKDLRSMGDGLEVIDNMMAAVYAAVAGKKSKEEFLAMMDKTSWFDGQQAVELGLATHCEGDVADPDGDNDEITDAEKRIIASFEKTIPENLRARVLGKAPAARASLPAGTPPATNKQPTAKKMNKIIAALVAAGFAVATDANEDAVLAHVNTLISDRTGLKAKLDGHETALKNRVTAKVEKAITDKLIKAERKDNLIKAGLADESALDFIDDIRAASAESTAKTPRGVRPAARMETEGDDVNAKIAANSEKLANGDLSAEERGQFAAQGLELRGLKNLFKKQTAERQN